jgi:hypothetical protein
MSSCNIWGGGLNRPPGARRVLASAAALLLFISGASADWHIRQVAYMSRGIVWTGGYVVPYRMIDDSPSMLVFHSGIPNAGYGLHFYRYSPLNRYTLVKVDTGGHGDTVISPGWMCPWAAGDMDGDSQAELVAENYEKHPPPVRSHYLATLYRPPSQGSCPDSLVWRVRFESVYVYGSEPFYITDLDQDGKKEITFGLVGKSIRIFENSGHDSMRLVAQVSCARGTAGYGLAFGDFDNDGAMEFATAGTDWDNWVHIYKCVGDNLYLPWDSVAIQLPNGLDVFESRNLDGTHHATFFVGFQVSNGRVWLYQFEPTQGTKGYQPFPVDSGLVATSEVYGRSVCGDIDGDGIDEVLWSMGTQIQAYKCTGPHQWQRIWYWWNQGGNSCNINLYDMNGNGYNEILESGSNRTNIFEIEAIRVSNPNQYVWLRPGDTCRIRWQTFTPPRCDSVSLFLRMAPMLFLDTIAHGLSPAETSWLWTVPHLWSDSCRIQAIAYGPGWQYDESDTCFRIAPSGVEESASPLVSETRLLGAFPNPLTSATSIQFQLSKLSPVNLRICDVSGRTVATLTDGVMKPGIYRRDWEVAPTVPNGIYFLDFTAGAYKTTRKLVIAR